MTKLKLMFDERVVKTKSCWEWKGTINHLRGGYGYMKYKGKMWRSNRLSYYLHNGKFDTTLSVCHKCDNPSCVNPDHLFLGTQRENLMDASRKNRMRTGKNHGLNMNPERKPWGERNGQSKLSVEDVVFIRKNFKNNYTAKELSNKFKVSEFNIYKIISRKLWPNV